MMFRRVFASGQPDTIHIYFDTHGGTTVDKQILIYGNRPRLPIETRKVGYKLAGWTPNITSRVPIGGEVFHARWVREDNNQMEWSPHPDEFTGDSNYRHIVIRNVGQVDNLTIPIHAHEASALIKVQNISESNLTVYLGNQKTVIKPQERKTVTSKVPFDKISFDGKGDIDLVAYDLDFFDGDRINLEYTIEEDSGTAGLMNISDLFQEED